MNDIKPMTADPHAGYVEPVAPVGMVGYAKVRGHGIALRTVEKIAPITLGGTVFTWRDVETGGYIVDDAVRAFCPYF